MLSHWPQPALLLMVLCLIGACLPPLPATDTGTTPFDTDVSGDADVDSDADSDSQDSDTHDTDTAPETDLDGDGYIADDCNNYDPYVHPDADEVCNQDDDDCDALVDDDDPGLTGAPVWYPDTDADGYGNPDYPEAACVAPAGHVANHIDCDDGDAAISPGGTETCNGLDDDCDGTEDDGVGSVWYLDADGDHYGDPAVSQTACTRPSSYTLDGSDCYDLSPDAFPGQVISFSSDRGDGSFDYNCDGVQTEADTHCSTTGSSGGCCWDEGWGGANWGDMCTTPPPCGGTAGWYNTSGNWASGRPQFCR